MQDTAAELDDKSEEMRVDPDEHLWRGRLLGCVASGGMITQRMDKAINEWLIIPPNTPLPPLYMSGNNDPTAAR